MATKMSAFRLGDLTLAQIDVLAEKWGLDKTATIRRAIAEASSPDIGNDNTEESSDE